MKAAAVQSHASVVQLVARVCDIEADEGPYGPRLTWWYEVDGPNGTRKLRAWTGRDLHPMSRASAIVKALLNRVPRRGEELDLAELIGKECTLEVEPNDRGFLVVKNVLPPQHDPELDDIPF